LSWPNTRSIPAHSPVEFSLFSPSAFRILARLSPSDRSSATSSRRDGAGRQGFLLRLFTADPR
jgi:hypothetical protein